MLLPAKQQIYFYSPEGTVHPWLIQRAMDRGATVNCTLSLVLAATDTRSNQASCNLGACSDLSFHRMYTWTTCHRYVTY